MELKIIKSPEEWQAQLTPLEYRVLRQSGTEAPFTGEYTDTTAAGIYRCRACGTELFRSAFRMPGPTLRKYSTTSSFNKPSSAKYGFSGLDTFTERPSISSSTPVAAMPERVVVCLIA